MAPIRIVIADDHPVTRQGLAAVIRLQPSLELVGEAGDGREAVEAVRRTRPEVVLMDLVMPRMGGVAAIEAIKAELPAVRIIALTTFAEADLVHGAVQAGADGYLLKDVDIGELVQAIHAVRGGSPYLHAEATRLLLKLAARPPRSPDRLTEREREVLALVAQGLTNRQIAGQLDIAEKTVSVHVSNLLTKLGLSSRTQAALYAAQAGLV